MAILQNKKVSVIVPNYNYGRYIKKRIKSILKQTYPIYELIILDDASVDGSVDKILRVLRQYGIELKENRSGLYEGIYIRKKQNQREKKIRVRMVVSKKNSGKAMAAWRKGWELSTGDYVWIAEADDLCTRKFLEEVMQGFKDPEVILSYAESMIINERGLVIAPNFRWSRDKEKTGHYDHSYIKDGVREIEEIMAIRCTIPNVSAVIFRKEKEIPYFHYFDESIKFSQVGDWYFYIRVMSHGKISYCRHVMNKFRIHKGSKTSGSRYEKSHYEEVRIIHKLVMTEYNINELVIQRMVAEEKRIMKRIKINS